MKKIHVLAILTMGLCSISMSSYSDAPSCAVTSDEKAFEMQLSDDNKVAFCAMSADQREACMKMRGTTDDYGNVMTADQCVESMCASKEAMKK